MERYVHTHACTWCYGEFSLSLSIYLSSPQVQSKVNLKYDYWHKEIVGRFGSLLGQNMQDFYTVVSKVTLTLSLSHSPL